MVLNKETFCIFQVLLSKTMFYVRQNQPHSKLESHSSDWESLQLWSTNDSSSKLTYLIEREALPNDLRSREINSSTKSLWFLTLGLMLCLILYSLGLITLSRNIHSLTQQFVIEWVRHSKKF